LDQAFLITDPLASFAEDGVGLGHDSGGGLAGGAGEVAAAGMHAGVVETEGAAEAPNGRGRGGEFGGKGSRREDAVEGPAGGEFGGEEIGGNAGEIAEESVALKLAEVCEARPMLDDVEVAEDDIDLEGATAEPGAAVHEAAPRAGREDGAAGGEGGEIDGAAVVEAEVPITIRIAGGEGAGAAQNDGDSAGHGSEEAGELSDRLGEIIHEAG
jgi:hypothetical protein